MPITLAHVTTEFALDHVRPTPLLGTAWVIETGRYRSGRLSLSVACPHCWQVHYHGTDDLDDLGYRRPHCPAPGGYELLWPTDEVSEFLAAQRTRCVGLTKSGTPCRRPAGRGKDGTRWLCPAHLQSSLSGGLHLAFDYPVA